MAYKTNKGHPISLVFVLIVGVGCAISMLYLMGIIRVSISNTPYTIESPVLNAILDGASADDIKAMIDVHPEYLEYSDPIIGGPIDWVFSAEKKERARILKLFLQHGISPDSKLTRPQSKGHVPLYESIVAYEDRECVLVLLESGASIDSIDESGRSALQVAQSQGTHSIAELIREYESIRRPTQ